MYIYNLTKFRMNRNYIRLVHISTAIRLVLHLLRISNSNVLLCTIHSNEV